MTLISTSRLTTKHHAPSFCSLWKVHSGHWSGSNEETKAYGLQKFTMHPVLSDKHQRQNWVRLDLKLIEGRVGQEGKRKQVLTRKWTTWTWTRESSKAGYKLVDSWRCETLTRQEEARRRGQASKSLSHSNTCASLRSWAGDMSSWAESCQYQLFERRGIRGREKASHLWEMWDGAHESCWQEKERRKGGGGWKEMQKEGERRRRRKSGKSARKGGKMYEECKLAWDTNTEHS